MMKKYLLLLIIIGFLPIALLAQKTKEESATEKYVLRLHENKFRWMVHQQLDSLNAILDERVVYVHSNGWTENKKEIIEDLRSGKLKMNQVTVLEATARVYKGAVIINGKGNFQVIVDGKPVDILLLYTEVYVKREKGWLLVSRHANKINP